MLGFKDLDEYTSDCFKEIEEKLKCEDIESARKIISEKIYKLQNWWISLPQTMKDHFDKEYKKCLELLTTFEEELRGLT